MTNKKNQPENNVQRQEQARVIKNDQRPREVFRESVQDRVWQVSNTFPPPPPIGTDEKKG